MQIGAINRALGCQEARVYVGTQTDRNFRLKPGSCEGLRSRPGGGLREGVGAGSGKREKGASRRTEAEVTGFVSPRGSSRAE